MNQENAQNTVNSAALVLAAIYFYRKLIEPAAPTGNRAAPGRGGLGNPPTTLAGATEQFFGRGEVAPTGRFIVGWGFTFLTLSITVGFAPELAAALAALVAVGSILGNGTQVAEDVQSQLTQPGAPQQVDASAPTVTVSFAGHPSTPASATMPQRSTAPGGSKPRQSTHPRTTLA